MELKRLTKISYRLEPNPDGGFIARATDPAIPPIMASTREELLKKLQEQTATELASELAGLKLPFADKVDVQIQRKPGTSLTLHSTGANAQEELSAVLRREFPGLSEALASADTKTFGSLNQQKNLVVNASSQRFTVTETCLLPAGLARSGTADAEAGTSAMNAIANTAITPEPSTSWSILRVLLAFLILAVLVYFFRHH